MSDARVSRLGAGIDVGQGKCVAVLVDEGGQVLAESRIRTPPGADDLIDTLVEMAEELRGIAGGLDGLGVGLPGLVTADGVLRYAPNLVDVSELPIRSRLQERLELPVVVDNDSNCAIWAEHRYGALQGVNDAVLVTIGGGVGTGVLVGGRLIKGANGFAGELGHIVVDPDGERCGCGRVGCWETVASAEALTREAQKLARAGEAPRLLSMVGGDVKKIRGEHVMAAAREGGEGAISIVDDFARRIASGLSNYVTLLDPAKILIGAAIGGEFDLIVEPLRRHLDAMVFGVSHRPPVHLEPAALGDRAGALGAADLGRSLAAPAAVAAR